jgi:hypothetical protein
MHKSYMQRWISPRDVLDLWEELERDVEKLGVEKLGEAIEDCKHQESEVLKQEQTPLLNAFSILHRFSVALQSSMMGGVERERARAQARERERERERK